MKKILIIGSLGMLGQELVKIFKKDKDYKVIAWDRSDIDVAREKEVSKKIGFIKPSIIINATAYNAVDKCEEDKKELEIAKKVNSLAPRYLAKAAKKIKRCWCSTRPTKFLMGSRKLPNPKVAPILAQHARYTKDFSRKSVLMKRLSQNR